MTKRDVAVALVSAAIVAAAMYYGGPRGGDVAKEVVVPAVEQAILGAERDSEKADDRRGDRTSSRRKAVGAADRAGQRTPGNASRVSKGTRAGAASRIPESVDLAYYRLLLRDGVFPVIRHEVRP